MIPIRFGEGKLSPRVGSIFLANQKSALNAGTSPPWEVTSTRGVSFSSSGCRSCKYSEGFTIWGWDTIVPVCRWLR